MKVSGLIIPFFSGILFYTPAVSQNVSINVLTRNSGIVEIGKTIFFEVTINNTNPASLVGIYKLKAQISAPDSIVTIQKTGHNLPTGWEIVNNTDGTITLSNGKDIIAPNDSRTLLIAIQGKNIGGPATLSGQLSFSNGISPGTEPGSLKEDNPADNYSTSSCKVIN
ncbi:MAG: hypothetical protein IPP72_16090 [Chitinophagaceae bacterium]|nr:hypothetical protein [Chitinophagaceae bacterium]